MEFARKKILINRVEKQKVASFAQAPAALQCGPPQKRRERSTIASIRLLTNSKPVLIWADAVPVVSAIILSLSF